MYLKGAREGAFFIPVPEPPSGFPLTPVRGNMVAPGRVYERHLEPLSAALGELAH